MKKSSARIRSASRLFLLSALTFICGGCAVLHHVAIGDIDNYPGYTLQPFEIMVSETGVNFKEAAKISKVFLNKKQGKAAEEVANIISLFQMGPHTGNGVFVKDYAKDMVRVIYEKCPTGRVTGLVSMRETRKYPVISGEIVKVTGYCLVGKEG